MKFDPIPCEINIVGKEIVDTAFKVHKTLGPGLLEAVYEECVIYDLRKKSLHVDTQVPVPIYYGDTLLKAQLRLDLLVEKSVIVELKSVEKTIPLYEAQLMTYLHLTNLRLGFLINFNVPLIKNGIKRMVM